jgi:prolyl-tRNA editing enzyme YbaK/EbsC (Cys-tRNA(Pro) deacylase)
VAREWPESVERVAAFLRSAGAEARIEELPEPTATAVEAARAVGCRLSQIVKSLVFDCDGNAVVVLVPGDRRVDPQKVAAAVVASAARIATPVEVEEATGFAPGAVAPFPLPRVRRILIDRGLLAAGVVWVGAGSPSHLAAVAPQELMRLARATPMDAVVEQT